MIALSCLPCTFAFTAIGTSTCRFHQTSVITSARALPAVQVPDHIQGLHHLPSALLTAAETFDGSTIVDPVVVSGAVQVPDHIQGLHHLPSSILTAVETFDGSTIVDPVVVSGAFWTSLKAKLLSVIIGQILATVVFVGLSSVVASQLPKLGEAIGDTLFKEDNKAKISSTINQFATDSTDAIKRSTSNAQPDFGKLVLCLLIDTIGTSSELIPIVGEATDVVWAPIAALGLRSLYGSNVVFGLELVEEILPFTDIIPLATICWCIESFAPEGDLAKALGIGNYGANMNTGTVIDTTGVDELPERGNYLKDAADPRK